MTTGSGLFVALLLAAASVQASPQQEGQATDNAALFRSGVQALERGAIGEAVDAFELLADRGFVHPDVSFNRAVAYVKQARGPHGHPGDLGRAAAALSETLALRPDDATARLALGRLRSEIGRQHARDRNGPTTIHPSIARTLVGVLPERVWAVASAAGSLLLTIGLVIRALSRRSTVRLGGAITLATGAFVLFVGLSMTLGAWHFRASSDPAIVVATEARLLSRSGAPMAAARGKETTLPEGARVHVLRREGTLALIEWGESEGWVLANQIRVLPDP